MLQSTLNIHKSEKVDESFYFDKKSLYDLVLRAEGSYFQACAYSRDRLKYVMLADFEMLETEVPLKEILQQTDFLQRDYEHVVYIHNTPKFLISPLALHNDKLVDESFKVFQESTVHEIVMRSKIPMLDAVVDFSIDSSVAAALKLKFSGLQIVHQASAMMAYIGQLGPQGVQLFMHVNKQSMDVCLMHDNTCLLYNQFAFSSDEEFLYFPVYIAEQYGIEPKDLPMVCMGQITESEQRFQGLSKRFHHIQFAARDKRFQYAHRIEEQEDMHTYQPLFSAISCV
jgi:hypothetical protein